MENQIDISIIIPFFNAEKNIAEAINSLHLENWNHTFELLLIDDGSSDNSKSIASSVTRNIRNVKIISQKNSGVSKARNTGIAESKGRYIFFADSDDLIHGNILENSIDVVDNLNVDLVIFNYQTYNKNTKLTKKEEINFENNKIYNKDKIKDIVFKRLFVGDNVGLVNLWNKIYKAEIIRKNQIKFSEWRTHGEDWEFNINYYEKINNFYFCGDIVYTYCLDGSQNYNKYGSSIGKCFIQGYKLMSDFNAKYTLFPKNSIEYLKYEIRFFNQIIAYLRLNSIVKEEKISFLKNKTVKRTLRKIIGIERSNLCFLDISRKHKLIAFLLLLKNYTLALRLCN